MTYKPMAYKCSTYNLFRFRTYLYYYISYETILETGHKYSKRSPSNFNILTCKLSQKQVNNFGITSNLVRNNKCVLSKLQNGMVLCYRRFLTHDLLFVSWLIFEG